MPFVPRAWAAMAFWGCCGLKQRCYKVIPRLLWVQRDQQQLFPTGQWNTAGQRLGHPWFPRQQHRSLVMQRGAQLALFALVFAPCLDGWSCCPCPHCTLAWVGASTHRAFLGRVAKRGGWEGNMPASLFSVPHTEPAWPSGNLHPRRGWDLQRKQTMGSPETTMPHCPLKP